MGGCEAVLNLRGEHYGCDSPYPCPPGYTHGNQEARAIWRCGADRAGDETAGGGD